MTANAHEEIVKNFFLHWFDGARGLIRTLLLANGDDTGLTSFYDSIAEVPIHSLLSAVSNVYFNVSTLSEQNGTKEAVLEACGLWADLDGIDYLSGEKQKQAKNLRDKGEGKGKWKKNPQTLTAEEFIELMGLIEEGKDLALKALNKLPPNLQPTFAIDTGKGYQVYWRFRELIRLSGPHERESIELYNKRLAFFLGADHTININRIFRVPYTRNVKLKDWSLRTEIIAFHPERQFNPLDFDWLPEISSYQKTYEGEIDISNMPTHIPDRFWILLESSLSLKKTWEGKRQDLNDTSGSGFDMALADLLVKHRFLDGEIARILLEAPYPKGSERTEPYLKLTIKKARSQSESSEKDEDASPGDTNSVSENDEAEDTASKKSQADRIVALFEKLPVTLFHDEFGDPYARFRVGGHFEIWRVRSKSFKRWLSREFWNTWKKVPNSDSLNSALNVIEAKACFEGNKYELHNRVAWYEDAIWYDLGNWKAVKITKEEWEIVDEPPILFRRYSHQKAQAIPQNCDIKEIDKIFDFVNIKNEEHRLLYKASLNCSFVPDIPHPIDVLHGDQGSAKTTVSQVKKELADPSKIKTLTFPGTKAEFVQQANHHWLYPLDNLTGLPEWLSDALCRAVTGEGFSKRELYTDDEDIIYQFKRCVSMNGINLVPTKPDLLDRSLIFELDQIPREEKKNEVDLWNEFEEKKPRILGALFSLVSKAMKEYGNVKLRYKPRMADFATWGCAVARALGKEDRDFIMAYFSNIKIQNEEALEASPVARVIMNFMDGKETWAGTPSELLEVLDKLAAELKVDKDKRYPKDSRWLWKRLKEVRINLQAAGILVGRDNSSHKNGRKILLKWIAIKGEEDPSEPGEDHSQQRNKNNALDDILSPSKQSQGHTGDNTVDNTSDDVPSNVPRNPAESFDSGQQDNKDNISETLLGEDDPDSWEAEAEEFLRKTGGS